ncbi:unnamed protein product [Parnassius apollo]|uniref:(apollo) hypothetical protein n=1 Tax=Parnassius apollo TaxID=110799 RepID=A0A8S3Y4I0_PARAO|nr:unnamed protein product [Parnassius apollo]
MTRVTRASKEQASVNMNAGFIQSSILVYDPTRHRRAPSLKRDTTGSPRAARTNYPPPPRGHLPPPPSAAPAAPLCRPPVAVRNYLSPTRAASPVLCRPQCEYGAAFCVRVFRTDVKANPERLYRTGFQ